MQKYTPKDLSDQKSKDQEELKKFLSSQEDIDIIIRLKYDLDPSQFEHFVARYYQKMWYETVVQWWFDDEWVDVIATQGQQKLLIQCKKWLKWHIQLKDLSSFYGMAVDQYPWSKLVYITTTRATPNAKKFARQKDIEFVDYKWLIDIYKKFDTSNFWANLWSCDTTEHQEDDTQEFFSSVIDPDTKSIIAYYDIQIQQINTDISILEQQLFRDQMIFSDTIQVLDTFWNQYNNQILPWFVKKSVVDLEIKKTKYEFLEQRKNKKDVMKKIEKILKKFDYKIDESLSEEKVKEYKQEAENTKQKTEKEEEREVMDDDKKEKVKSIYKRLASKFHPDRYQDEESKKNATAIFQQINDAYIAKDINQLFELEKKYTNIDIKDASIDQVKDRQQEQYELLTIKRNHIEESIINLHIQNKKIQQTQKRRIYQKQLEFQKMNKNVRDLIIQELKEEIQIWEQIISEIKKTMEYKWLLTSFIDLFKS